MTGQLPELETARLRLRRPTVEDAPWIARMAADYDVARMTARMPHPYAEEDARRFLEAVPEQDPSTDLTWVMEDRAEGPIGVLAFFSEGWPAPELGYWLGRPFWSRGYASEAVSAAIAFAERDWRKKLVVAGHFADNPASGRVLEKAGFLYTGVVEHKFSLARGEDAPLRRMVRLA
jgi:RimJ/RimL family protein N-acetyltransferase